MPVGSMPVTPGLARFTATEEDDVPGPVTESLERDFTVTPDRAASGAAERLIWFDTFDWRLFKAGFLLAYVPGRRGSELRLTTIGTEQTVTQPVTGWGASRPHPASDIPPGAVASRITGLVEPRALLPVASATRTTTVSRLLNSDDKTVARLVAERYSVPGGAAGGPAGGQCRFGVRPVRGYPGQARKALRLVEESAGVARTASTVLEDLLAAEGRGRVPGDYSNKVNAPVTAEMPAPQAIAVILLHLLDAMESNTDGVIRDIDTEFLHDFRVAVRRTRTALKLFGDALPARDVDVQHAAAEFKWLGDLTTPTRDLDVHLLGFDAMTSGLRAGKPDDLEPFREYLIRTRARECRALARGLRSPRYAELARNWRAALAPVAETRKKSRGTTIRSGEISAAALVAERTRRAFAKVAKRGGAITPDSPHEYLHDLRKRCKELRYALEFFAPLYDADAYKTVLGDLKRLQDCLGDFQDNEVQIAEIRALALELRDAPAVTLLAMGEITAGLAVRQDKARRNFERRFEAFADAEGQRRMSELLRGCGSRNGNGTQPT